MREPGQGIVKSALDTRIYSEVHLESGLKVLLISDVETTAAAASCDVAVGSYHESIPGRNSMAFK